MRIKNTWRKKRAQAGDTLVEVLIAIGVGSLVLVGAYASTHRNTQSTQDAQERVQALKLVETQIEHLRNNGGTISGDCFSLAGAAVSGPTNCRVNSAGVPSNDQPFYNLSIVGPAADGTYAISAKWDRIYADGVSSVDMYYRPETD